MTAVAKRGTTANAVEIEISGIGHPTNSNKNFTTEYATLVAEFTATSTSHIIQAKIDDGAEPVGTTAFFQSVSMKEILVNADFTFSRDGSGASPATRVNSAGLIEKGRTNLLLQSNSFDTTWTNTNTTETSGQSGYDGTNDAWLLTKTAAFGQINQSVSLSGVHTFSVYAKEGTTGWMRLVVIGTANPSAYFNLSSGAVGTTANVIESNSENIGNGWYRYSISLNQASITEARIYPAEGDNDIGATSGNIVIQDAQLEKGLVATSYIETTTAAASAGILGDMPRLDYSGGATCPSLLLEPARTNSFPQSEYPSTSTLNLVNSGYTWSYNETTSPEGVQNAAKWSAANNNAVVGVYQNFSATSGTTYSFSVFAKKGNHNFIQLQNGGSGSGANSYANFDLENGTKTEGATITDSFIEDFGSGWYRIGISFTVSSTGTSNCSIDIIDSLSATRNSTFTGSVGDNFYVWGMQVESASYPTSYVPSYGSATARAVDQLETSPYDYQSQGVLGANVGTIILDCETIGTSTGSNDFHMFGAVKSIADGYLFRGNTGTTIDILERNSNATSAQWTSIADKQTRNKIGVSYNGSDVDVYVNGVSKSVSSGTPVGGGNINGFSNSASNKAGLIIHQILLFPTKLTDSEMANITTL